VAGLADPRARAAWDGFVLVSDWHRASMVGELGLAPEATHVVRNAIGPRFEGLFGSAQELLEAKRGPARVVYTSTPFRGLDVLLHAFGEVRRRHPAAVLDVYSSMAVYQVAAADDPCAGLYADCAGTSGARYHGSLPQPELVGALTGASFLGYPNTFPETSCIAVMEALAAGLGVVTTGLGALPETCLGHAELVPPPRLTPEPEPADMLDFSHAFAERLGQELGRRESDAEGWARARLAQVRAVNASCTWSRRAEEWEHLVAERAGS
jgi:glycosyltransferase involved in cell wall biosynthesis